MAKDKLKAFDKIIIFTVLFIPFQYLICEIVFKNTQIDNAVRDVLIVVLFIYCASKFGFRKSTESMLILISAICVSICFIGSICSGNNALTALNAFRIYIIPMLAYFIFSVIRIVDRLYILVCKSLIIEIFIICIYGIFQAFILKDSFLVKIGYPSDHGHLTSTSFYISGYYGTQRVNGIFTSPNVCGVIVAFAICLFLDRRIYRSFSKPLPIIGVLSVTLLLTFSRSAILGLIIAVVVVFCMKNIHNIGNILLIPIVALISIGLFVMIDYLLQGGKIVSMILHSFTSIFNGSDPSANGHFSHFDIAKEEMLENPWGFGFGQNGPMAAGKVANAHLVESSYYLMFYELGILLGTLFFMPLFYMIISKFCNLRYRYFAAFAITTTALVSYIFLPGIQTVEITFYLYMFIGLYFNKNIINEFIFKEDNEQTSDICRYSCV